jgi:exodeoxyribonuclease VII small subunit
MKPKTFEEKLEHSRKILEKLMNPDVTLEESVKLYEEGLKTIQEAQKMIEEAQLKVETLTKEHGGAEK